MYDIIYNCINRARSNEFFINLNKKGDKYEKEDFRNNINGRRNIINE